MRKGVEQDIQDKRSLREYFKKLRKDLSEEEWRRKSDVITLNFLSSPFYHNFIKFGFYYPVNREVDIRPALVKAISEKEVYLPRTDVVNKRLTFHRVIDIIDLTSGGFGVPEPHSECPQIDTNALEVILVPGVAFDRNKGRLGYGGGFYDRVLSGYRGIKIGIAFSFQIVDEIPLDEHDVRMDFIITEEGIF